MELEKTKTRELDFDELIITPPEMAIHSSIVLLQTLLRIAMKEP